MTRETLAGKQVVVAVTGSIAAVEVVKLIHELRRHGAVVQTVMSEAATGIITPDALTYASGRPAITCITGLVEHVSFCGDEGTADLLLIVPCTANTISKIACAIDDTPVTTFATTALGRGMPVLVIPAMHHSMFRHPGLIDNIRRIEAWGVEVIGPRIEEGKAKIAGTDEIVLRCERALLGRPLAGKRALITSGPCREPVDDVRILTTRSTGQMGRALALEAFRLGADVTVVHNDTFPCVRNIPAETAQDMHDQVLHQLNEHGGTDIYISAAAISDFAPEHREGKIPSGKPVTIDLHPLPKLLDAVRSAYNPFTVAFKIGRKPETKARAMIRQGVAMVLMNTPETMGSSHGAYTILDAKGTKHIEGTKDEIAAAVWSGILRRIA
ncbi:bifunctional phosphopantothenoylcysteine decarboxylase/phosphopantothenate--cysteine ligase CoaBC [Methanoregula sp.]|jgi:phosphopantothenoylcysteine decarboxylase / phosphopantothenate---cysteine ligase|uniref:bifunctional phosphopantothenoylcysteine decarboxylase/phosphopantothenate--cysteine ligase CoaBC n=1 Tax=Methanoregula sp. TaxID=2052170 RepID=UPI003C25A509